MTACGNYNTDIRVWVKNPSFKPLGPYSRLLTSLLRSLLVTYQALHLSLHFCRENVPRWSYFKARALKPLPNHTKARLFTASWAVFILENFAVDILPCYRSRKTRASKKYDLWVDAWRGIVDYKNGEVETLAWVGDTSRSQSWSYLPKVWRIGIVERSQSRVPTSPVSGCSKSKSNDIASFRRDSVVCREEATIYWVGFSFLYSHNAHSSK